MRQNFDLPWEPQAKERPRVAIYGGRARAYTPAKTRNAEAALRYMLVEAGAVLIPKPAALTMSISFRLTRPASLPKKFTMPIKKPDVENLAKTALDAANGVLYEDDSQVVDLHVRKVYGVSPGIEISIQEMP